MCWLSLTGPQFPFGGTGLDASLTPGAGRTVRDLSWQEQQLRSRERHPRLLTRTVAETPEHKQVSGRLLHRQIKGSAEPEKKPAHQAAGAGQDDIWSLLFCVAAAASECAEGSLVSAKPLTNRKLEERIGKGEENHEDETHTVRSDALTPPASKPRLDAP
ncbi:hypothetical protein MDA_GLEAN10006770 [Myotis davidii]|uniref:Uncharacterized protein n=1 Tax=Myotis davidii TaxID=225400 RepID=L5LHT5_MYODS|nr:hypothetical protein MDA_GLEAN10006770 [Myotis davidii]